MIFFLGALAGPLIGLGSSLFGAGGPSKEEKALMAQQTRTAKSGERLAGQLGPMGRRFSTYAQTALGKPADYYSRLLGGGRGEMTDALAPEIGQINDAYQSVRESEAALRPRGGGRATLLSENPYNRARDISTLFQSVRPGAAKGLADIGGTYGGLGSSAFQNAVNALYQTTASGRSNLDALNAIKQRQYAQSRDLGRSLFDIGQGLYGGLFSGSGKSGSGSSGGGANFKSIFQ